MTEACIEARRTINNQCFNGGDPGYQKAGGGLINGDLLSLCMISIILTCASCTGTHLQKNGSSRGKAKYRCYDCGHQAVFAPAAPQRAAQYEQVMKLAVERNSQRSIVRVTGVARMTIAKWIKKSRNGSS